MNTFFSALLTVLPGLTLVGLLGVIAPASAAVESTAPAANTRPVQLAQYGDFLQEGDASAAVEELQRALHRHGLYELADVDGQYGPLTVNAVKKYQANRGLPVTGVADSETLTALGIGDVATAQLSYPGYGSLSTDELSPADEGYDVRVLQDVLRGEFRHDDTVSINGIYDDATRQAIRVFQRARGIQVTGIADRETLLEMGFQEFDTVASRPSTDAVGGPESRAFYYAVIVAGRNQLGSVQQVYSDAFLVSTERGEVISIGAFDSLRSAQQQATSAQTRGFQAEVIEGAELY